MAIEKVVKVKESIRKRRLAKGLTSNLYKWIVRHEASANYSLWTVWETYLGIHIEEKDWNVWWDRGLLKSTSRKNVELMLKLTHRWY